MDDKAVLYITHWCGEKGDGIPGNEKIIHKLSPTTGVEIFNKNPPYLGGVIIWFFEQLCDLSTEKSSYPQILASYPQVNS